MGGGSCMMARPVVDLPQPDSPTRPRVSPGSTSKLMPDTAWTFSPVRRRGTRRPGSRPAAAPRLGARRWAVPLPAIRLLLRRDGVVRHAASRRVPTRCRWPLGRARPGTSSAYKWPGVSASTQRRLLVAALVLRVRAARARSGSPSAGRSRSGGRPPMASSRVWLGLLELRDRLQQRLGVGHLHVGEQRPWSAPSRRSCRRTSRRSRRCGRPRRRGRG